jgi:hypothetical protein
MVEPVRAGRRHGDDRNQQSQFCMDAPFLGWDSWLRDLVLDQGTKLSQL